MTIEIIQTVTAIPRTLVTIETLSLFHAIPPRTEIEIGHPVGATVETIDALVAETRPLDADGTIAETGSVTTDDPVATATPGLGTLARNEITISPRTLDDLTSTEGGGHPPPLGNYALRATVRATQSVNALKQLALTVTK